MRRCSHFVWRWLMANQRRDAEKEAFWREVVQSHAASGISVRSFCREQQLVESAFYAWRRTIAEREGRVPSRKSKPTGLPRNLVPGVMRVRVGEWVLALVLARAAFVE